jgi:predicted small integral membrane protein
MRSIWLTKTALVATIAAFFTLVAFGNITDYQSNWLFVQHVLSMDTIFEGSTLQWRAIGNPAIQEVGYWLIIVWEAATAVVLWLAVVRLLLARTAAQFDAAKSPAIVGLGMGFVLYALGFVVVGGEWFAMWQSETWNGQGKAIGFLTMIGIVLIVVLIPETGRPRDSER